MNKIYRLIWSDVRNGWIAVPENQSSRGKRASTPTRTAVAFAGALLAQSVFAAAPAPNTLPTGGQVVAGQAAISQAGNAMSIQQGSNKAILNWNSFSIGSAASVNFQQPSSSAVALNRVTGSDPSAIYGSLTANGQVFLVNPNGVLFGQGARVDVGGLVASTLNISNADFLAGDARFTRDDATAGVTNQGELIGKYVALLAPEVRNEGVITATMGTATLAAGEAVTLNLTGNALIDVQVEQASIDTLVENKHLVKAEAGTVILSAQSAHTLLGQVVNSGAIEAQGLVNDGGTVRLLASSAIDHSGSITADAGANGNGGSVILMGDLTNPNSQTTVSGSITAKGGSTVGDGGFIETSGSHLKIADSARIDTSAVQGKAGTWLLDPVSFTVAAFNGDITGATLASQLTTNNVTLAAQCATVNSCNTDPAVVDGDIFVNDTVSWGSASILTLDAGRNININAPITVSGNGGVALKFGQAGASTDMFPPPGNYLVKAPINLSATASFSTQYLSDGAAINYNVINDATELANISNLLTGNYVLGTNLTLSGNWTPLGDDINAFDGIFDGLGHTISGLSISGAGANNSNVGLFGVLRPTTDMMTFTSTPALIQNVGLIDANVSGLANVGALVGKNEGAVINSYATSTGVGSSVITGRDLAGVGINVGTNDDTVTAIGGLVGYNTGGIAGSYANVTVTATSGDQTTADMMGVAGGIGGFVGAHISGSIISNYAAGNVTGLNAVGGFAGHVASSTAGNYSRGLVTGTTNKGGFIGKFDNPMAMPGFLAANFWDTTTSGQATSAGQLADEVTGMTTAQMMVANNFKQATAANGASVAPGWENSGAWELRDGSYPLLADLLKPLFVYANNQTTTYNGSAVTNYSHTISSAAAVANTDYTDSVTITSSTANPTNAGSYTLTPSGLTLTNPGDQNGYRVSYVNGTLTIEQAALTAIIGNLTGTVEKVYDGTDIATLSSANYLLTGWVTNTEGATVTKTAGTYASANANADPNVKQTVTVSLTNGDYTATGTTNLANYILPTSISGAVGVITKRPVAITPNSGQSKVYGEADPTYTYAVQPQGTGVGLLSGDTLTLSGALSRAVGENVADGPYAYTIGDLATGNGNYSISLAGGAPTFAITQRPVTITPNSGQSKVYGEADPTYTYAVQSGTQGTGAGLLSGDTLTLSGALGRAAGETVAGGPYAYTIGDLATGNGNYSISLAGGAPTFAITQRPVTITPNSGQSKVYGEADPTYTYAVQSGTQGTGAGLLSGDTLTLSGALSRAVGENVADAPYAYTIGDLATGNGNYSISLASGAPTFAITQRPITLTANPVAKDEGGTDPTLAVTASASGTGVGVATGDTLVQLTGTLTRQTGETAGNYDILLGTGAKAGNYAIIFIANNNAFTINSSFNWDGGGSSDLWSLAANWRNDTLPQTGDRIQIGSGYSIVYDIDSLTLASLDSASPITFQAGKQLTLTMYGSFTAPLTFDAGSLLTAKTLLMSADPTLGNGAKINITTAGDTLNGRSVLSIGGRNYTVINDLAALRNMSGNVAIGSDIDGSATQTGTAFSARSVSNLAGLGHTIRDLKGDGFIATLSGSGIARDIGMVNVNFNSSGDVGGLVRVGEQATIRNCYVSGAVSGSGNAGGLLGYSYNGNISNSYASVAVSGSGNAGGLLGYGGGTYISNSYAGGAVSGSGNVGGLLGYGYYASIDNSYTSGAVSGSGIVGGLLGNSNNYVNIHKSYAIGEAAKAGVAAGGEILTDAQFTRQASYSGWDFTNTWDITTGATPWLKSLPKPASVTVVSAATQQQANNAAATAVNTVLSSTASSAATGGGSTAPAKPNNNLIDTSGVASLTPNQVSALSNTDGASSNGGSSNGTGDSSEGLGGDQPSVTQIVRANPVQVVFTPGEPVQIIAESDTAFDPTEEPTVTLSSTGDDATTVEVEVVATVDEDGNLVIDVVVPEDTPESIITVTINAVDSRGMTRTLVYLFPVADRSTTTRRADAL